MTQVGIPSYLDELRDLVLLHARAQGIRTSACRALLARVDRADGTGPGSWVHEWSRAGERLAAGGRHLDACRHFTLARFPCADSPERAEAGRRCVSSFDDWRRGRGIDRFELDLPDGRVACWTNGLAPGSARPLLLVMGGIVSVKEQWAQFLLTAGRLGMAAVATEMPGVGENTLTYRTDSWRMVPTLLDALGERAPVDQTYALALSFSGQMAIRAALHDPRLRGVATVGAPVRAVFGDPDVVAALPATTLRALEHLTGRPGTDLPGRLAGLALTTDELGRLDIPVAYVRSRRDEIVPGAEPDLLARHVRGFTQIEFDDVHGSPAHLADTRLWIARALLGMRASKPGVHAALGALLAARAARRRFAAAVVRHGIGMAAVAGEAPR